MPLKLNLKKGERLIINGALLSCLNSTSILIHNRATLLHENQIMKPDEANSPARRIYFNLQAVYMANDEEYEGFHQRFVDYFDQFYAVIKKQSVRQQLDDIRKSVDDGEIYKALKRLRDVIDYEDAVIKLTAPAARQGEGG